MIRVMEENTHTKRMAFMLALMLVLLVAVSIGQFTSGSADEQQAAVLRAYAE